MTSRLLEKSLGELKVSEYHLIFDLNGILVVIGEGPTKSQPMILRLGLKKFLFSCVIKFIAYIWFSEMRRNFSKHSVLIKKRTNVYLKSARIVDQAICFKNEHFSPKKLEKHVLHKNLNTVFGVFFGTNYANTLLVNDTPYKSLFNPPLNAIFLETFYWSQADGDYLFGIVFPYLEALHFSKM